MAALARSYRHCAGISRRHGATFFWATKLLPPTKQRHVHALYALARTADDMVDLPDLAGDVPDLAGDLRGPALSGFSERFFADLVAGRSSDPVLAAAVDTIERFRIDAECFRRFFRSMEMDLSVTAYETWDELLVYMDGSAAAIGEMMLPILEPLDSAAALGPARDLGLAFQLTNFLRDIAEDLDRGRQYLPQEDLERFGVELNDRRAGPEFVSLMQFEIRRCRALYGSAAVGIDLLPPRSARCIRAAHDVYAMILERIEGLGYDVFSARARVPTPTKLAVTARQLVS